MALTSFQLLVIITTFISVILFTIIYIYGRPKGKLINCKQFPESIPKRMVVDSYCSKEECDALIEMIKENNLIKTNHAGNFFFTGYYNIICNYHSKTLNNLDTKLENTTKIKLIEDIKNRMMLTLKTHFQHPNLHVESMNFVKHTPYPISYAHEYHSDNCHVNLKNNLCFQPSNHVGKYREYTMILYLNTCDGGEFNFYDSQTNIIPEPGKAVFFSAGPENIHGVKEIKSGERYSISLWATSNEEYSYENKHNNR